MTCIVGIEDDGRVVMGADRCVAGGWRQHERDIPKISQVGPYLLATTGSVRDAQVVAYGFDPPRPPGDDDSEKLIAFMCTKFVDSLRARLLGAGVAKKENEVETGISVMVGVNGRVLIIYDDHQVSTTACGYQALGSGELPALGSLHTTASVGPHTSNDRVKLALEAAAAHTLGVAPPFDIMGA